MITYLLTGFLYNLLVLMETLSRLFGLKAVGEDHPTLGVESNKKDKFYRISGPHHLRDNAIGFIDSRALRSNLFDYIKDNLKKNANYVIGLDAQNLGVLNDVLGREKANKIWQLYATEYMEALSEKFPNAGVLCGFRGEGDEAIVIISGRGVTDRKIKDAFAKAEKTMQTKFSGSGLSELPSRDGNRPKGFRLHHAVCPFFNLEDDGRWGDENIERTSAYMREFKRHWELASVMTELNRGKKLADQHSHALSSEEFVLRYRTILSEVLDKMNPKNPIFVMPEELFSLLPFERDSDVNTREHREFLEQAPPNAVLLRFDLTGLRLLNKVLHSAEVEGILGDIHSEVVGRDFKIMSSTYGVGFMSREVRSGVIDILIDQDVWAAIREESIEYINWTLNNLYDFHIGKNYRMLERPEARYRWNGTEAEKREAMMSFLPDDKRALLEQLEKEFNFVEAPVVEGDIDETLRNVAHAMDELKRTKQAKAQSPVGLTDKRSQTFPGKKC